MPTRDSGHRRHGEAVVLRYITVDGRIEICWPCRVVEDSSDLVALYIAAGTRYKAGPKLTAAEKRRAPRPPLPADEYLWRTDTLRMIPPGQSHSVSLSWDTAGQHRRLLKYFINMEQPVRRTAVGFDTQDLTIDIEVTPELTWSWRDEQELANHVAEGLYSAALASAARAEGERAVEALVRGEHVCRRRWAEWRPPAAWQIPPFVDGWDTTLPAFREHA